jgi:AcrR family transcriptional regulator
VARTRLTEAERREILLAAAVELAREQGLALTTGRDVASRAGVSVGLVQYYFGSVEEMWVELFDRVQREDLANARRVLGRARTSRTAVAALVDYFTPTPGGWRYRLWIDAWSLAPRRPLLRAAARRLNLEWRDLIVDVIERAAARGDVSVADVRASAWRVLALLDAMHIQLSTDQVDAPAATVRRWVRQAIEAELGLRA